MIAVHRNKGGGGGGKGGVVGGGATDLGVDGDTTDGEKEGVGVSQLCF